jgi:LacI family transcriptional regulator
VEPSKRVTLKDIAEKTGFTITTVSRALKDMADISEATKKFINKSAEEMGYIWDATASSMRSGQTNTLAVIVGDIANPFFCYMIRDIESYAREAGFNIIIYNTGEESEREKQAILSAYSKRVDGIIICPVQEKTENIRLLQKMFIPFVLVGRYFKNIKTDTVHWDDVKAGELAAGYLLDKGHVNILYIGAPLYISSGIDRLQGYRNAFAKQNVRVNEDLIRITSVIGGSGGELVIKALEEKVPFTAIMAHSDHIICEILYTLGERLNHVEVIGFDNIQGKLMLPLNFPSIDSIDDEAKICVELLTDRICGKGVGKPSIHVLDVELKNTT